MEWCRGKFKLVLVDAPPILGLADFELIAAGCDGVVLVVRARKTDRAALQEAAGHLDPKRLLGIVFNGHAAEQESLYGYYMRPGSK
jgi:Mrp family chromosome partitioning ATPase